MVRRSSGKLYYRFTVHVVSAPPPPQPAPGDQEDDPVTLKIRDLPPLPGLTRSPTDPARLRRQDLPPLPDATSLPMLPPPPLPSRPPQEVDVV
jgi:hypothetical protein